MAIEYQLTLADYKEAQAAHPRPISHWRQVIILAAFVGLVGWDLSLLFAWQIRLPAPIRVLTTPFLPIVPWIITISISLLLLKSSAVQTRRQFDLTSRRTFFGWFRRWVLILRIVLAAAPWILGQAAQWFQTGGAGNPATSLFFIWLLVVLTLRVFAIPSARRKLWLQQPNVARPKRLEYSSESVTGAGDLVSTTYKWAAFSRCVETANLFMLYPSGVTFHMIPKRAFPSPEAVDEFRQLIQEWADGQSVGFPVIQAVEPIQSPR